MEGLGEIAVLAGLGSIPGASVACGTGEGRGCCAGIGIGFQFSCDNSRMANSQMIALFERNWLPAFDRASSARVIHAPPPFEEMT
jgi:hypothetical protein